MNWTPFYVTAGAIVLAIILFFIIRFFRRMNFMIEEMDARLVQIRNMLQGLGSGPQRERPPADRHEPSPLDRDIQ